MIATIDKFANVPWEGRAGAFFGHVERDDTNGFYGAAEPGGGTRLPRELRPIDLIIQDELHLISGPLGTIAGLYETAFDLLASRTINGERRGPKIVASTATVRERKSRSAAFSVASEPRFSPRPALIGPTPSSPKIDKRDPIATLCRRRLAGARAEARLPSRLADVACRGGRALDGRQGRSGRSLS